MSNVVLLVDAKKAREVTSEGPAKCLYCSHEWHAIAPVGTYTLDCPACSLSKGIFSYPFCETGYTWVCNCGNGFFQLTPFGALCPKCGVATPYSDLA